MSGTTGGVLRALGGITPGGRSFKTNLCVGGTGAGLSGLGGLDGAEGKLERDERYPGGAL